MGDSFAVDPRGHRGKSTPAHRLGQHGGQVFNGDYELCATGSNSMALRRTDVDATSSSNELSPTWKSARTSFSVVRMDLALPLRYCQHGPGWELFLG